MPRLPFGPCWGGALEESILLPFDSEGGVGQRLGRQRRALVYPRDLNPRQAT